ncbi:L-aspartate oxidase [Georgenia muralis]|uniref:L-aspartate oxidase n=1 Tax=Georgenia muralis TaxID=154117 RepID=A0A3N4Z354_9MICO|nr:L-aspartate oxidase [Georgenia muralis]RPF26997.1 L-aspartate oxidase [Georgenia muralis]
MRTAAHDAPVVVVGGGLAGLLTALHLAPLPCMVLTTGELGEHTSSDLAQGGIAAALDDGDAPALHALDTVHAGAGLCDVGVVEAVTGAAPETVAHLARLGARFDRAPDGAVALGLEGAHSRHRVAHAGGDATGRELLRAAAAAVRATPSVAVLAHTRAGRLVLDGCRVTGVVVERDGERSVLAATAVVLATGGLGGLFRDTTNPTASRGQGVALAARAGAVLRDLEMVQFHPTALDVGLDPMPLVSEAVRGEGAHLVTADGARLLSDDLAPRDVVSRAVFAEQRRGGRVLLDARGVPGFAAHFPTVTAACRAAGIDPSRDLVPVRPAAHYAMGGVAVDSRGRTSVAGLWAVGEVASTGLHGANRLASNSLLEAAVCAGWVAADVRAARSAAGATTAQRRLPLPLPRAVPPAVAPALPPAVPPALPPAVPPALPPAVPSDGTASLRALMSACVGVLRDGPGLAAAAEELGERVRTAGPDAVDDATLTAFLVATSAQLREESRGAHTRTDFPAPAAPVHTTLTLAEALEPARNRPADRLAHERSSL